VPLIPTVIEKTSRGERAYDIYSRLLEDRIIILGSEINDSVANTIIAQLLFLEGKDDESEIQFYINSPGGVVTAGLAILDTMNYIKAPVSTICIGQAASMAAVLLACGEPGKRKILPNSRVLIHQPLGGARGQASDIEIASNEILRIKTRLNKILADACGQETETIKQDTDRDNIKTAEESLDYGLVDTIIKNKE
tara:strand:+ start:952 stop:1536 length:585 start_codon:yes stop_codon:yes gene_type:complete